MPRREPLLKERWNMILMPSATIMIIITARDMSAAIMARGMNAAIIMAMKGATIITAESMSAAGVTEKALTALIENICAEKDQRITQDQIMNITVTMESTTRSRSLI